MREAVRNALRSSSCLRKGITHRVCDGQIYGLVEDDGKDFDLEAVGKATHRGVWGCGP
jgi:signal transduction histidine kinase